MLGKETNTLLFLDYFVIQSTNRGIYSDLDYTEKHLCLTADRPHEYYAININTLHAIQSLYKAICIQEPLNEN